MFEDTYASATCAHPKSWSILYRTRQDRENDLTYILSGTECLQEMALSIITALMYAPTLDY